MKTKLLEIRDAATFIPALAIQVSKDDGYLMRRAGFRDPLVYLVHLVSEKCGYDPYNWTNRTMLVAHQYIESNFDALENGEVVDVEFILGKTKEKKLSEEITAELDYGR